MGGSLQYAAGSYSWSCAANNLSGSVIGAGGTGSLIQFDLITMPMADRS